LSTGTTPVATGPGARVYRTSVWSTRAELVVTDGDATVAAARILHGLLDEVDATASRFRDDSELRRLERSPADRPHVVSPLLFELLEVARRAAVLTDGRVDPTVGAALVRLGYDRDFPELAGGVPGRLPGPAPVAGGHSVVLDRDASTVTLPAGVVLDLGATAKAWTADRAAERIAATLGCGVLASLGGDLAVRGAPAGGFTVGVADVCGDPDAPLAVTVDSGGLATSGIGNRRWSLGGTPVHHLVDPATGLPVDPVWRTVSVAAGSCVDANTASTAAMVLGSSAPEWLGERRLPSRLVAVDGTVRTVAGWPDDPVRDRR
jgi:thiamine biosynthesis lipoprotein